uniref:Uncharacterized protein n=1 Tax=Mycena chlorophos TaxID=658473 RepID=A0ABQ0LY51_MYCCL|nr:predicted protein [Mycena chlorophos]
MGGPVSVERYVAGAVGRQKCVGLPRFFGWPSGRSKEEEDGKGRELEEKIFTLRMSFLLWLRTGQLDPLPVL